MRSILILILAAVAGVLAGCGAGHSLIGTQQPQTCGRWNVSQSSQWVQGVAALSPTDTWAVGGDLLAHWDGHHWSETDHPPGYLAGVAAISKDNVWATGWSDAGPLLEHWDGRKWTLSSAWPDGRVVDAFNTRDNAYYAIFSSAPSDVWFSQGWMAEVSPGTWGPITQVEHWDGRRWTRFPAQADLVNLTNDSDDVDSENSWAAAAPDGSAWEVHAISRVGRPNLPDKPELPGIFRWTGHRWRSAPNPKLPRQYLFNAITALRRNDAWAIAKTPGARAGESFSSIIERWNGKRWATTPLSTPKGSVLLEDVTASSTRGAWAVGAYLPPGSSRRRALVLRWNGKRWMAVPFGGSRTGSPEAVAMLPSGDAWAVGDGLLGHFKPCRK